MSGKKKEATLPALPRTTGLNLELTHGIRFEPGYQHPALAKPVKCWIGLDLSLSATGVCILREDGLVTTGRIVAGEAAVSPSTGKILKSKMAYIKSDVERIDYTADTVHDIVFNSGQFDIQGIALEGFSHGSKSSSLDRIHALGWAVRKALNDVPEIPKLVVPPTTLKKAATGLGSSDKEKMAAAAAEHHNISVEEIRENFPIQACNTNFKQPLGGSDEIDAFFLALLAKHQSTLNIPKVVAVKEF